MREILFTILLLSIFLGLLSIHHEQPMYYYGDELANRSDDPRITDIAHIHSNPTLNSNEIEAKVLWDSLFTALRNDASSSTKNIGILINLTTDYWTNFTPKEIVSKNFDGVHIFFMQNLNHFYVSEYMCATYNSKIYLMPTHFNDLMSDMGINLQSSNKSLLIRRLIESSISSPVTVIDSTVADSLFNSGTFQYNIWEQRNGLKHQIDVCINQDSLFLMLFDRVDSRSYYNGSEVIIDLNKNSHDFHGKCIKGSAYPFISRPLSPILKPLTETRKTE